MSASFGHSGGGDSQDVEINLAPIIDAFTVLITFMLASATFLSIGILDAGVSAPGAAAKPGKPPAITLTVNVRENHVIELRMKGKASKSVNLKSKDGSWDQEALTRELAQIRKQWPDLGAATLQADNSVEYKQVIQTMDTIRKTHPAVLLGGF